MASYTYQSHHTIFIYTIIFIILSYASAAAAPTTPKARKFTKIFAFGDSYTDTGNTRPGSGPSGFLHSSSSPYGTTFFHRPTRRYSDGRLVIDFVAEALSLPYLPPYIDIKADTSHGVNFAVAGSTAINHEFFVKNNMTLNITPQSIQTELLWFHNFLQAHGCVEANSTQCRELMDDALFWIGEIGVNDYAYTIGSDVSFETIQPLAINSMISFLEALLKTGAKYVVVQGLPPTGCLPLTLILASPDDRDEFRCVETVNELMKKHNYILQAKLIHLRKQFPNAIISYADFWSAYHVVMKHSHRFKFKEPFKTCCGTGGGDYNYDPFTTCGSPSVSKACPNPSEYINWDGVHLTEAMYKVISNMFLHGPFAHPQFDFLLSHKREES
ncbi:hypothetical protein Syun_024368 [Stephania yunnanensis]|uniref:Uncharacterized protein n=1 Tax=Stephania yunnanensis TaxID=152371 RepID=A0AAP0I478_9MAGN